MSLCSLSYLGGVLDRASAISCGSGAVTCPFTGRIIRNGTGEIDTGYTTQDRCRGNDAGKTGIGVTIQGKPMHGKPTQGRLTQGKQCMGNDAGEMTKGKLMQGKWRKGGCLDQGTL